MRRTKETQTFDMDGEQVEIDVSGEGGKMLADLLRGGGKRKIVSKSKKGKSNCGLYLAGYGPGLAGQGYHKTKTGKSSCYLRVGRMSKKCYRSKTSGRCRVSSSRRKY
jgi:hypothetical protein